MAKKDNNDETPIKFYIPGPGRRSRAPIPINQPHWIYKPQSNIFEWLMAYLLVVFGGATFAGNVINWTESIPLLLLSTCAFLIGFAQILSLIRRNRKLTSDTEKDVSTKKSKEKKLPKRRKDFK
jgi:hypothetical protein